MTNSNTINLNSEMAELKKRIADETPGNPVLSGWASYSQCDEDGIIRECLDRISNNTDMSGTFVEIGCSDGLENNTHQLLLDGSAGVWVDGDGKKQQFIKQSLSGLSFDRLLVINELVSIETASALALRAKRFLDADSLDFFSLDIDGNDIHVMPPFVEALSPKLICVEYNAKFVPPTSLSMAYNEQHRWSGDDYFGASLQSWVDLMHTFSYSLVCCNLSGANAFFVKNEFLNGFSNYAIEQLYQPARYALVESSKGHHSSLKWLSQSLRRESSSKFQFVTAKVSDAVEFDFAIHSKTDQFISNDLAEFGVWEPFETKVFSTLCSKGDVVLDLGANIGWYSILATKLVGAEGAIFSFEPDGLNARLLEVNASISDQHGIITITKSAVGDTDADGYLYKSDSNLGDHRMFSDGSEDETNKVTVTKLDTFFSEGEIRLPDIVKSDTQGSESKVLRGAQNLLSQGWRPIMIIEFWPFGLEQSGDNPTKLWEQLLDLGYVLFEVNEGNPKLVPITNEWMVKRITHDIRPETKGFINILCIHKDSDRVGRLDPLM